jgi:hypothetical protein
MRHVAAQPVDLGGMILTDDADLAAVGAGCTGVTEGVFHIPAGTGAWRRAVRAPGPAPRGGCHPEPAAARRGTGARGRRIR